MGTPNWFVALPVPAGDWYARMPAPPAPCRRFHPADLHLTVAFLGRVEASAARAAWDRALAMLQEGPIQLPPFAPGHAATMGGGHRRMPRELRFSALALEPAGPAPALDAFLRRFRDPLLAAAGARPDRRAPRPHCTVARPGFKAKEPQLRAAKAWGAGLAFPGVAAPLTELALYTWAAHRLQPGRPRRPDQPQFQIVERVPAQYIQGKRR